MPRRLTDDVNELKIKDNISGCEIVFYYALPATSERSAYANECFRREGGKIKARLIETRQKYGLKVLAGIREGDFEVKVGDEWRSISSDPKSENYAADWKKLVAAHAGDLLELLAAHVFDGSATLAPAPIAADDDDEGLEKN